MARLPIPGSDDDTWGNILNDYLEQAHKNDGTLADNAVTTDSVTNTAITEPKLATAVQTKINAGIADATASTKGQIRLTGDLGGTATSPTVPGLAGKANTSHTHAASDITSGTLDIARIPTGTTGTTVSLGNHTHDAAAITSGTLADARIPSLATSKITSGTFDPARLPSATDTAIGAVELATTAEATTGTDTTRAVTPAGLKAVADTKAATSHTHTFASLTDVSATAAEANYLVGVTSAIQTQLNAKAPLASPALTGTPTAPTAATGTNTTQVATTAFVNAEIANDVPSASETVQGRVELATTAEATTGTDTTRAVTPAGLKAVADTKAASSHTHTFASLTDISATAAEANYLVGVTSAIQTQLNSKAASSHTHAATDITSGTLADARLSTRLGSYAATITDWNNANTNGWYMGNGVTNGPPGGGWALGFVEAHNNLYITQTVHRFTSDTNTNTETYRRANNNGTWTAWYKLQLSQDEQDARYSQTSHTHTFASLTDISATPTQANYLVGVTSAIQTQLDGKAATSHTHDASAITAGTLADARLSANVVQTGNTQTISGAKTFSSTVNMSGTAGIVFGGDASINRQMTNTLSLNAGAGVNVTYGDLMVGGTTRISSAGAFSGSGASITSLNASNLASGTVAAARLPAATDTAIGAVELATTAEATTGTDTTRAVTPAGLKAVADTKAASSHTHTFASLTDISATAAQANYLVGVTSAIQTQLNAKAPLASPALTGTPTAPTATAGTNTTQVATTAFVTTAAAGKANTSHTHSFADVTVTALAINYNLNNCTTQGYYYQPNMAPGMTAYNYPESESPGFLEVIVPDGSMIFQRFTIDTDGSTWTRYNTGTWSAWSQLGGVLDATETYAGKVERATNAEVRAGTDTTRYVSPAGLAYANETDTSYGSLSGSGGTTTGGYTKMIDGTLICWITCRISPSANSWSYRTWTYPVAFTTSPSVTVTARSSATTVNNAQVDEDGLTSARIGIVRSNTTDTYINAQAIGRWK